jgi:hypothetical protein
VRIALGDEPLNMVGMSYGSQIGAQYASLFPDNIRVLVLDGMLQHSQSISSNVLIESLAYATGLRNFFNWAGADEASALKGKDVESLFNSLLTNATVSPLPAPRCNDTHCRTDVNKEEILFNTQPGLIFQRPEVIEGSLATWGSLASAIYNATYAGDASAFSTHLDDPSTTSGTAIACLDWNHDPETFNFNYFKAKQHMSEKFISLTNGACQTSSLIGSCIGWPLSARNPPEKMNVDTATTVMMVNSDSDPSTGYTWAVGSLEEIKRKAFVTRIGDGHTSFLTGGETARVIGKYLISGEAPEDGMVLDS